MLERRKVEHYGIRLEGLHYYHPKMLRYVGQYVLVKRKKRSIKLRDMDGVPICKAKPDLFK